MSLLKWLILRFTFAIMLFLGFIENVEGMKNLTYFIAWLDIISSTIYFSEDGMSALRKFIYKQKGYIAPKQLNSFVSYLFIFTFVWFGSWVTGLFLFLSFIITESAKQIIYSEKLNFKKGKS